MAQCQKPRPQMARYFLGFIYIRQEDVAKIPKVPGALAPRNVNPARTIAWLVGVKIYCSFFQ